MSYSFSVTADTKAEAIGKISQQFDAVVAAQPSHAADKDAAVAAAKTFIGLLGDPHDGDEVNVSMSGSLGWKHDPSFPPIPEEFLHASVNIHASLRNKAQ